MGKAMIRAVAPFTMPTAGGGRVRVEKSEAFAPDSDKARAALLVGVLCDADARTVRALSDGPTPAKGKAAPAAADKGDAK